MDFNPSAHISDVRRAARIVAQSYMRFSPQDIAQAILMDMCQAPQRYRSIKGPFLFKVMMRAGYRYCQNQASRILTHTDQYTYSAEEVRALLAKYYEPGCWPYEREQPSFDDYEGTIEEFSRDLELWVERTHIHIDLLDIETALAKLKPSYRRVIEKRYRDHLALTEREQKRIGDAIRILTYFINEISAKKYRVPWDHEGPGARKAMSNAKAKHLIADY